METAWRCLLVIGALGVGYEVVRWATTSSNATVEGKQESAFKQALKDPTGMMQWADATHAAREQSISQAAGWSDVELAKALRNYLFSKPDEESESVAETLQSLGPRFHAPLREILADSAGRPALLVEVKDDYRYVSPFSRACELLEDFAPASFAPIMESFLSEPSKDVRRGAARVLGVIGQPPAIAGLRKALADDDEYVRSNAMIGLNYAADDGRLSPHVGTELFDDVAKMVAAERNVGSSAPLLLRFDADRGRTTLLNAAILTADYPRLHEVLDALANANVLVPRDLLLPVLKIMGTRDLADYPNEYAMNELLQALGRHRNPEDRALLERYSEHAVKEVTDGAAEGLVQWHGLEGFHQRIGEIAETKGEAALTKEQREYDAMMWLDGEVRNGGFSQYFFNSAGRTWQDALSGFETLGETERAAILREAVAKFGKKPPAIDRSERMLQLATVEQAEDEPFGKLDTRYYACKSSLEAAAKRYVVAHPQAFR